MENAPKLLADHTSHDESKRLQFLVLVLDQHNNWSSYFPIPSSSVVETINDDFGGPEIACTTAEIFSWGDISSNLIQQSASFVLIVLDFM